MDDAFALVTEVQICKAPTYLSYNSIIVACGSCRDEDKVLPGLSVLSYSAVAEKNACFCGGLVVLEKDTTGEMRRH